MKIEPVFVRDIRPRKVDWPERHVTLPMIVPSPRIPGPGSRDEDFEAYDAWLEDWKWLINYSVHKSNLDLAKKLAKELSNEIHKEKVGVPFYDPEKSRERIEEILKQLRSIQTVPFRERTPKEKWTHMMVQLPGDIGGPNKDKIRDILSSRCSGRVLEAMCGFNSYLLPSSDREVIALDWCREALELYPYPERTRILFDLNIIKRNRKMEFFEEGEFSAITICFGFHYLLHPICLFREFRRLLSLDGQLILIENPVQRYRDMACRPFSPRYCKHFLKRANFGNIQTEELPIAEDWEERAGGHYFLVEAKKS